MIFVLDVLFTLQYILYKIFICLTIIVGVVIVTNNNNMTKARFRDTQTARLPIHLFLAVLVG